MSQDGWMESPGSRVPYHESAEIAEGSREETLQPGLGLGLPTAASIPKARVYVKVKVQNFALRSRVNTTVY
jgi:hypothetical protein